MKKLEGKKFFVELISDSVIRVELFEDAEIGVDDILALYECNRILSKGEKYVLVVVANHGSNVTKEAREVSADLKVSRNRMALAFVVTNLAHKLLVNFFIKFNKPNRPTKMFSKENEALEWLKTFL